MATLYNHDGSRVVHHNNCTFCIYRDSIKHHKNKPALEWCAVHTRAVSPVGSPGRYCDRYIQIGCECDRCVELKRSRW